MQVQQHHFAWTDVKSAIRLDKHRITQVCENHDDGDANYQSLKYKKQSSKNVLNFYLDSKSKLSWCVIPKVKPLYS